MSTSSPMPRRRLCDIDFCKGLAILLVVIGHIADVRHEPQFVAFLRGFIYTFHMPLFIYLSGFLFFFTGAQLSDRAGFLGLIRSRFTRLMVPFLVVALLLSAGKIAAQQFVRVDDAFSMGSAADIVSQIFLNTNVSPVLSIWYLFVVFLYACVTPLLWRATRQSIVILTFIAAVMAALPMTDEFFLNRAFRFYIFFVLGGMAALNSESIVGFMKRRASLGGLGFVLFSGLAFLVLPKLPPDIQLEWRYFPVAFFAIWAIHGYAARLSESQTAFMARLGEHSLIIYLMNTAIVGAIKAAFTVSGLMALGFYWVFFFVALICSLVLPIVFKLWFVPRVPGLSRIQPFIR